MSNIENATFDLTAKLSQLRCAEPVNHNGADGHDFTVFKANLSAMIAFGFAFDAWPFEENEYDAFMTAAQEAVGYINLHFERFVGLGVQSAVLDMVDAVYVVVENIGD